MPSREITNTTRDGETYDGYLTEPEGDGKVPGILVIPAIFGSYEAFDAEQGYKDVEDLLNDLRANPRCNGRVAVLGYCFGGRYAQYAVARLGADAAGAFHGTMIEQELNPMPPTDCPVSYHFGAEDPVVPVETVETIREAFAGHDNAAIVVHDGAGHNFSMPTKDGYHAGVAATSRQAVLDAFDTLK